ncbi:MAG: HAD-IIA family hydrolase [Candidatus Hadarchaeales archaeon]
MLRCRALDGISGVIIDLDGVVWVGRTTVAGVQEAIQAIRRMGKRIVFTTNNSSKSRKEYVKMLRRSGGDAEEHEVLTSGYAAAEYLRRKKDAVRAHVVGERGLREELVRAGIKILPEEKSEDATHLVVGLDRTINYRKIWFAMKSLMSGAEFVATNTDPTYPTELGLTPGAGAIVGAISGCSGRNPDVVLGKPYPYIMKMALELLGTGAGQTAIIGDRLEVDVKAGKLCGIRTILVLSGVTKREDLRKVERDMRPDFVFNSLSEVVS